MTNGDQVVLVQPNPTGAGEWTPTIGEHISQLGEHLRRGDDGISEEEFRGVRDEARRILSHALPPADVAATRTGLVVGCMQAGKTMSMTAVSALAFDNGFRLDRRALWRDEELAQAIRRAICT